MPGTIRPRSVAIVVPALSVTGCTSPSCVQRPPNVCELAISTATASSFGPAAALVKSSAEGRRRDNSANAASTGVGVLGGGGRHAGSYYRRVFGRSEIAAPGTTLRPGGVGESGVHDVAERHDDYLAGALGGAGVR